MRLSVKLLHGTECWLEVPEDEAVSALKVLIEKELKVPRVQQRLLFKGKALSDEHRLTDYGVRAGAKLNLVVKSADRPSPEGTAQTGQPQEAWQQVAHVLGKHFTPADAGKVLEQLQKDYTRKLHLLSLDDVERISTRILHPDTAETMDLSFME